MRKILTLTKVDLLDSKISIAVSLLVAVLLGLLFVAFFPTIRDNADSYNDLLGGDIAVIFADVEESELTPEQIEAGETITPGLDLSDYNSYIAVEYFSFFWAVVLVPFLVSWGTKLAGQAEKGTLALFLSQPVSRTEIILSQLLSVFIKSGLLAFVAVAAVWLPALPIEGVEIESSAWIAFSGFMVLICTSFALISMVSSMSFMNRMRGVWITTAIVAGGYLVTVFTRLVDEIEALQYLSVWYYMGNVRDQLSGEPLFDVGVIFFTVVILAAGIGSWFLFKSKDMPNG